MQDQTGVHRTSGRHGRRHTITKGVAGAIHISRQVLKRISQQSSNRLTLLIAASSLLASSNISLAVEQSDNERCAIFRGGPLMSSQIEVFMNQNESYIEDIFYRYEYLRQPVLPCRSDYCYSAYFLVSIQSAQPIRQDTVEHGHFTLGISGRAWSPLASELGPMMARPVARMRHVEEYEFTSEWLAGFRIIIYPGDNEDEFAMKRRAEQEVGIRLNVDGDVESILKCTRTGLPLRTNPQCRYIELIGPFLIRARFDRIDLSNIESIIMTARSFTSCLLVPN